MVENVMIMGAAGREFHNFNAYFRDNQRYRVVCFTATQIPDIQGRRYPSELTGRLYPEGIPIHSDNRLFDLVKDNHVDLTRLIIIHKPSIRYGYKDHSTSTLAELIRERIPA